MRPINNIPKKHIIYHTLNQVKLCKEMEAGNNNDSSTSKIKKSNPTK